MRNPPSRTDGKDTEGLHIAVRLQANTKNKLHQKLPHEEKRHFCRTFNSALGRTRTCDLLIRSQSDSPKFMAKLFGAWIAMLLRR